ncbi:rlmN [Symbiodinium microadriaticum]|nr:rlmN [Symbiodinium microadriaticum]
MAPSPPKRIRRKRVEGLCTLWDYPALLRLLDSLDIKRSHAEPLLRALTAKVVQAPPGDTWGDVGVTEQTLVDLGLPKRAAEVLERSTPFGNKLATAVTSADGSTTKMVFELHDGHKVESVVMRHDDRTTICVSSQVGCQMGCTFCATGTMPVVGDLDAGEIVEQLLAAQRFESSNNRPAVRNAVFMGMGEPLNNYDSVLSAVKTMTDLGQLGSFALPQSRVTISTVGVVPRMRQLARDLPGLSLALSLHAPTQELRQKIVPSAKNVPMEELLAAMDLHLETKTARAMIEYVLLADVNDTDDCAKELGQLLAPRARKVMVNLIPYNPGASSMPDGFRAPQHQRVERFQQILANCSIMTRVRREMGQDISGACGQLALTVPQEGGSPTDLEDFVAWRRRQPQSAKNAVQAECAAVAAAVTCTSQTAEVPQLMKRCAQITSWPWFQFSLLASAAMAAAATLWLRPHMRIRLKCMG